MGARSLVNWVHVDTRLPLQKRSLKKLKSAYYFMVPIKKEKAFWLGPQLLSFHCLWPRTCRCLSRHLAKASKCVRSLLGLNDNRNHPSWEGNLFIWWPFIKWQVFLQDFLQWDISNQLGALPSLNQLLVFECHKTKSCEIKPAVWAMKMGCWDETAGPSHIISVHHYDANYGKHY